MKTHTKLTIEASSRFDGLRIYGALLRLCAERSTGRLYTPETANDPTPIPVPIRLGERAYLHAQLTPEATPKGDSWEIDSTPRNCPVVLDPALGPDEVLSTNHVPDHEERYTVTLIL